MRHLQEAFLFIYYMIFGMNDFVLATKKQKKLPVIELNYSSEFESNNTVLYWNPIKAGLLTNFLNLKYVYQIGNLLNRSIVINDTRTSLLFCDVFKLPKNIPCSRSVDIPCIQNPYILNVLISPTEENIRSIPKGLACIRGSISLEKLGKTREHVVKSIDNDLELKLSGNSRKYFAKFKSELGIKKGDNFTVVNWNKGIEFGAVVSNMRMSQLVAKVKESTMDSIVYIISSQNRPFQDNTDFGAVGFRTFLSVGQGLFFYLSDVQIFELEISLALEATTYLDWSINGVHDLIESLRMKANQSYCVNQLPLCAGTKDKKCTESITFCNSILQIRSRSTSGTSLLLNQSQIR